MTWMETHASFQLVNFLQYSQSLGSYNDYMASSHTPLWLALDRLAGGVWHLVPPAGTSPVTMLHRYHWQIEGALLVGESISPNGTSYSYWYWHPGQQGIRMVAIGQALGSHGTLAEYSQVEQTHQSMTCQLVTTDEQGVQHYKEVWQFADPDHYAWFLYRLGPEGETLIMQADFERRPK